MAFEVEALVLDWDTDFGKVAYFEPETGPFFIFPYFSWFSNPFPREVPPRPGRTTGFHLLILLYAILLPVLAYVNIV